MLLNPLVQDWLNLLIRWFHFLAGIMWIGTSLHFVWMDSSFEPPKTGAPKPKGIDGDLWMVHGGNFYHVEKRKFGPGEMPPNLHWFKWEATLTWVSGFFLLIVVYYLTGGAYLIDPEKSLLTANQASLAGLATLPICWLIYDGLFRSPLGKTKAATAIGLGILAALAFGLTHIFSGRGAFIHLGAALGTMMVLNVWAHILPNQRAIIEASNAGRDPNYDLGVKAKKRSMHNSYMTLPVLFIMISNHFPALYGHEWNAVVLILILILGASVRHAMITGKAWPALPALSALGVLIFMTLPKPLPETTGNSVPTPTNGGFVTFAQAQAIIQNRCVSCHSKNPTDDVFKVAPNGVLLDSKRAIYSLIVRIRERVVNQKTMPLANKTQMTEEERTLLGQWIAHGAPVESTAPEHL